MDINNILENCQKILYEGFTTDNIGDNSWLNVRAESLKI